MKNPTNMKKHVEPTIEIKECGEFIQIWTSGRLMASFTHEEGKVLYNYLQHKYAVLKEDDYVRPSER